MSDAEKFARMIHKTVLNADAATSVREILDSAIAETAKEGDMSIDARIAWLKTVNDDEADSVTVSAESERDLRTFIKNNTVAKPIITLLNNGNFRAQWRDKDNFCGIQFLGDGLVWCVAIISSPPVSKTSALDISSIRSWCLGTGASRLVYEEPQIEFNVGDRVKKITGRYKFVGVVVAAFRNLSGDKRYVVENGDGLLHIFGPQNLARADDADI